MTRPGCTGSLKPVSGLRMTTVLVALFSKINFWNAPDWFMKELAALGPDIKVTASSGKKDFIEKIKTADTLLCWKADYEELKDSNIKKIVFCQAGIPDGFENRSQRFEVITFPGMNAESVSEWAVALAFALFKGLHFLIRSRKELWKTKENMIPDMLRGKSALVLGLGHVGKKTAQKLSCLGMSVNATARRGEKPEYVEKLFSPEKLYEALPEADLVISALPLNPSTRHSLGEAEFAAMKKGAYFINISRGDVVVEKALISAIRSGRLRGAALDVFQREPLDPGSELFGIENLILTPHMAGSYDAYWSDLLIFLERILN